MNLHSRCERKVKIMGNLVFETAFHIGSGKQGDLGTNMGVLKDRDDSPILPGSTLKGNLRTFCERLAPHLGLSACLLDAKLSGEKCVSDANYRTELIEDKESRGKYIKRFEEFQRLKSEQGKLDWLEDEVCDVCKLFGSPLQSSRIFLSDGVLIDWTGTAEVRDGVCIDRDSETARPQAKYNYEVISRGTVFSISIEIENPEECELALLGAALSEWESGFYLGGFTSRGLGKLHLENPSEGVRGYAVETLDYSDRDQLQEYLLFNKMVANHSLLSGCLQRVLEQGG